MKAERRGITWETFKRWCGCRDGFSYEPGVVCNHGKHPVNCLKKNCPIWKRLTVVEKEKK